MRYSIINLIDKKNNNYKQSEFEKYITAKSKKEIEEEAKEIDKRIKAFLTDNNLEFKEINGTEEGYNAIVKDIIEKLGK